MSTLSAINISKAFGGIAALDCAHISITTGKITGLIGENGAGKSTIIKALNGIYKFDAGHIELDGEVFKEWSSKRAHEIGLSTIHQEILLVPELSVYQNVTLGQPQTRTKYLPESFRAINHTKDKKIAIEILRKLGVSEEFDKIKAGSLSPGKAQMILIARAISRSAKFLILDEPTAALPQNERVKFFELIKFLAENGTGILLVSHHLEEVESLCSEVVVFRDGKNVAKLSGNEINIKNMVNNMLARELSEQYKKPVNTPEADIAVEVKNISSEPLLKPVSFKINKGEIVGVVGLLGSGKTELARALMGLDRNSGEILVEGNLLKKTRVIDALKAGMILVPEERKTQAVLPDLGVFYNGIVTYLNINFYNKYWKLFNTSKFRSKVKAKLGEISVKYSNLNQHTRGLSGGNQQKLVIARALLCSPKLLILDEPTRGIDVGSKSEVYSIIQNAAADGLTVLIMSSELEEMSVICHRIIVLNNGEIVEEFDPRTTSTLDIKNKLSASKKNREDINV